MAAPQPAGRGGGRRGQHLEAQRGGRVGEDARDGRPDGGRIAPRGDQDECRRGGQLARDDAGHGPYPVLEPVDLHLGDLSGGPAGAGG